MRYLRSTKVTPSMVIAMFALLVALGGTSVASGLLAPANSVNSRSVVDHSLQVKDFKRGQLPRGAAGVAGATGAQGAIGPAGPAGSKGLPGPIGPEGPSAGFVHYQSGPVVIAGSPAVTIVAALPIPSAGNYIIWAKAYLTEGPGAAVVTCKLKAEGDFDEVQTEIVSTGGPQSIALNVAHVFPGPGTAEVECSPNDTETVNAHFITMTAVKVGTLTRTDN